MDSIDQQSVENITISPIRITTRSIEALLNVEGDIPPADAANHLAGYVAERIRPNQVFVTAYNPPNEPDQLPTNTLANYRRLIERAGFVVISTNSEVEGYDIEGLLVSHGGSRAADYRPINALARKKAFHGNMTDLHEKRHGIRYRDKATPEIKASARNKRNIRNWLTRLAAIQLKAQIDNKQQPIPTPTPETMYDPNLDIYTNPSVTYTILSDLAAGRHAGTVRRRRMNLHRLHANRKSSEFGPNFDWHLLDQSYIKLPQEYIDQFTADDEGEFEDD